MKKILKVCGISIGIVAVLYSLTAFFVTNISFGNFAVLTGGVILIISSVPSEGKKVRVFRRVIALLVSLTLAVSLFLCIDGSIDTTSYSEDALIVLGGGVKGENPSPSLALRLDKAIEYHEKNPNAVIVVSGGLGTQERIPEAEAMERYLVSAGVDKNSIIKEENSRNTRENFINSKRILENRFGGRHYSVCFITSTYHIFRSNITAHKKGFRDITHLHARTNPISLPMEYIRECAALIKMLFT